jgi:tetratricopeptide (TPR) repeat protein
MRKAFITAVLSCLVLILLKATAVFYKMPRAVSKPVKTEIFGCAPSAAEDIIADENGKFIPVLPGWGNHNYVISTNQDSTQFYFNQGLNLYYSYHLKEALASFKEAARFDKSCAITYWGQALAMGPFYNNPSYTMDKRVPSVIKLMDTYIAKANEKEKALIRAMKQRYSEDTTNSDRAQLDRRYASAMSLLIKRYPDDEDIKALYIDGVMLQHKWDFWYNNGQAKEWTPELVKLCERILEKNPRHPAALHYYIHITEASKHPEVALHSADVLKDAMPGTSHMVHMATHMYQRNGLFAKGVEVNEEANTASNIADSLSPATGRGKNTIIHYFAVQSYCAIFAGMYDKAMAVYKRARNRTIELNASLEKEMNLQFVYMMPVIAGVRCGKWQQVLETPSPVKSWKYASVLDNFAKGLGYVRNNNLTAAQKCLLNIEQNLDDSLLGVREMHNKPIQSCRIAQGILKGEILNAQGKASEAIVALKQAVDEEDRLIYMEPKKWLIPTRQYLGATYLKLKKAKEAEETYREDLIWNPANGWSLLGLYQSLIAQSKTNEAAKYKAAYLKAFKDADVSPVASVF